MEGGQKILGPYPTKLQLVEFRKLREAGHVSVFRAALCGRCQCWVPLGFLFCTKRCMEAEEKRRRDDLAAATLVDGSVGDDPDD